jgi:hypothetical protein
MKWKLLIILIVICIIPSVIAIEECKGTITKTESPCWILLTVNSTSTDCTKINATINNDTDQLCNYTMSSFNPSLPICNATFNFTNVGTYVIYYTTGDTGSIIIQEDEFVELSFVIGMLGIAVFLIYFAFKLDDYHFILKLLLIFFSLIYVLMIPGSLIVGVDNTYNVAWKTTLGLFGIFIIYFSVYLFYHWSQKSEQMMKLFDSMRNR